MGKGLCLLAVVLFVVASVFIGRAAYQLIRPVAHAQVLVIKNNVAGPGSGFGQDVLSTHSAILRSIEISTRALKDPRMAAMPQFNGPNGPGKLARTLVVSREAGNPNNSNVLLLSARGVEPETGVVVLQVVLDTYLTFVDEVYAAAKERPAQVKVTMKPQALR